MQHCSGKSNLDELIDRALESYGAAEAPPALERRILLEVANGATARRGILWKPVAAAIAAGVALVATLAYQFRPHVNAPGPAIAVTADSHSATAESVSHSDRSIRVVAERPLGDVPRENRVALNTSRDEQAALLAQLAEQSPEKIVEIFAAAARNTEPIEIAAMPDEKPLSATAISTRDIEIEPLDGR